MITVQNNCPVVVNFGAGVVTLTNAGSWSLPRVEATVAHGLSNYFGNLGDGAVIVVDANGAVAVVPGPELWPAAEVGFVAALSALGVMMAVRWAFGRLFRPVTQLIGD